MVEREEYPGGFPVRKIDYWMEWLCYFVLGVPIFLGGILVEKQIEKELRQ